MQLRNALLALLAGVVAFGLGTAVVTEALDPYVWPSLLVGIPVGVVVGVSVMAVTYVGVGYWQERRDSGTASARTRRRFWATVAAVAAGIVVGGVTVALLATHAVGLATGVIAGMVTGLVAAGLAAALVWSAGRDGNENEAAERTSG